MDLKDKLYNDSLINWENQVQLEIDTITSEKKFELESIERKLKSIKLLDESLEIAKERLSIGVKENEEWRKLNQF